MLTIGMTMSGYEITAAVQQFRATASDEKTGVVILGIREAGYVVATVPQSEVESERPARHWDSGTYTSDGDDALRRFTYKAGLPQF